MYVCVTLTPTARRLHTLKGHVFTLAVPFREYVFIVSVCVCVCAVISVGMEVMCKHRHMSTRVVVFAYINIGEAVKVSVRQNLTAHVKRINTGAKKKEDNSIMTRSFAQAA